MLTLAACGAGFCGAGLALQRVLPLPRMDQISAKLEAVRKPRERGGYSVLFFGSSKIRRGIIPALFDEEAAKAGAKVRSFNVGVDGMAFPESGYLCEQVLALHPPGLRYVVLELGPLFPQIPPAQRGTLRLRYWHDFRRVLLVERELASGAWGRNPWAPSSRLLGQTPAGAAGEHFSVGVQRLARMGEGSTWARQWIRWRDRSRPRSFTDAEANAAEEAELDVAQAGYRSYDATMPEADRPAFLEKVAKAEPVPFEPALAEKAFRDLQARLARQGVTLVLVMFPNARPIHSIFPPGSGGNAPPVFYFDWPKQFPELYDPENRESEIHLNHRGAQVFTRLLAREFAAWSARQP